MTYDDGLIPAMRRRDPGRGLDRGSYKRIVVSLPDETFDEIRALAVKRRTSFAEQIRLLVEWGLEVDVA